MKCYLLLLVILTGVGCSSWLYSNESLNAYRSSEGWQNRMTETRYKSAHPWWHTWDAPQLHQLMETAFAQNPSLAQAAARLAQAEASARIAGAGRLPSLELNTSRHAQTRSEFDFSTDRWSSGLIAQYELDLWGRVRTTQAAALTDTAAAEARYASARMSLSAEVALSWVDLLVHREEQRILTRQLEANQTTLELIELRFRNSLASALDVLQQRQATEAIAALLPLTERAEQRALHRLTALLGCEQTPQLSSAPLPKMSALPVEGLPVDLLEQRPDIQQAWYAVEAAGWRREAARAAQLPTLRLSGRAESSDRRINALFDDWYRTLAGSLSAPLFNRGSLRAETSRREALLQEQLETYRETVLLAIEEAENALITEQTQRQHIALLSHQFKAAQQAYEEAMVRYRNGVVEYTTVLLQLNGLQELERRVLTAQGDHVRYRIALHRALGGKWALDKNPLGENNDA